MIWIEEIPYSETRNYVMRVLEGMQVYRARLEGAPLEQGPEYDIYAQGIGPLEGWAGHTGEGFGHTVLVMHNADSGATVVVGMNISNAGKHVPTRYFRKIAAILDGVPPAAE